MEIKTLWIGIPIGIAMLFCGAMGLLGGATIIAYGLPYLDRVPFIFGGGDFLGTDNAFTTLVLNVDRHIVGLVGLSSPGWILIPAIALYMVYGFVEEHVDIAYD